MITRQETLFEDYAGRVRENPELQARPPREHVEQLLREAHEQGISREQMEDALGDLDAAVRNMLAAGGGGTPAGSVRED